MKNADMPASPCVNECGAPVHYSDSGVREGCMAGLTKREMFAMYAMQGELAGSANHSRPEAEDVANFAVKCADALLAELDK